MKSLIFYTKSNCPACAIMASHLDHALDEVNIDINIQFRHGVIGKTKTFIDDDIKRVPTTIIKDDNDKEILRLVGTYTVKYLIGVLSKL